MSNLVKILRTKGTALPADGLEFGEPLLTEGDGKFHVGLSDGTIKTFASISEYEKLLTIEENAQVNKFDFPDATSNGKEMVRKDGLWQLATGTGNSDFAVVDIFPMYAANIYLCNDGRLYMSGTWDTQNIPNGGITGEYSMKYIPMDYRHGIKAVYALGWDAFVLMNNGDVWSWGTNDNGMHGVGNTSDIKLPIKSNSGVDELLVPTGTSYSTRGAFIYTKKGGVWRGAGNSVNGRLGDGVNKTSITTPTELAPLPDGDIAKLWNFGGTSGATYALSTTNKLYASGDGQGYKLGTGTPAQRQAWTEVLNIDATKLKDIIPAYEGFAASVVAQGSTFFLMNDGTVFSCGVGIYGMNGLGNTSDTPSPTKVAVSDVTKLHVYGPAFGTVVCEHSTKDKLTLWGNWYGASTIGDGTSDNSTSPVEIPMVYERLIEPPKNYNGFIYSSDATIGVIKADESIWLWGYGVNGQFGDGTVTSKGTPQQLPFYETGIDRVFFTNNGHYGGYGIYILKLDGSVFFVGNNSLRPAKIGMFANSNANNNPSITRIDAGNEGGIGGNNVYAGTDKDNIKFPVGHTIVALSGASIDLNAQTKCYISTDAGAYTSDHSGLKKSTELTGDWAFRGYIIASAGNETALYERVL